ncbi:STAS domain-containing protein [Streptomyces sp. NPDC001843]|uniref:STAS domain-containing protein n=1 Tax=Streptomyces sp. NPDC001843 TaxID=3364617 RepID=UPI0036B2E32A
MQLSLPGEPARISTSAEETVTDSDKARIPGRLSVTSTGTDGIHVLSVAGEIDHDTVQPLRQALELSCLGSPPRVVIDMRQVTFMDSAGINLLITTRRATSGRHGWLRLAAVPDSVMHTLRIVELDTIIDCHPTLRDALHP